MKRNLIYLVITIIFLVLVIYNKKQYDIVFDNICEEYGEEIEVKKGHILEKYSESVEKRNDNDEDTKRKVKVLLEETQEEKIIEVGLLDYKNIAVGNDVEVYTYKNTSSINLNKTVINIMFDTGNWFNIVGLVVCSLIVAYFGFLNLADLLFGILLLGRREKLYDEIE